MKRGLYFCMAIAVTFVTYSVYADDIADAGNITAAVDADGHAHASAALRRPTQTVGLVLSGGGAKGIAEIGAIQALEENDIPIDYIAGTSMGAIVGGLYAAGYSPREMMELIVSPMFMNASTGTIAPQYYYRFFMPEQRPSMFSMNFGSGSGHSKLLPASIISPMPMNFSFMSIFSAYTAQCGGDFDRLFVPLRTVASDMTHKQKVVFRSGQLDDAVRASMSFPIVFKPVTLNGSLLYDGGIYDNFPVDVMREDFHPDIMIGIDIHSTDTVKGFPDILQQMDLLVIRPTNNYEVPEDEGIKMRIDLNRFGLLDFPKAKEIYEIGYRHALTMVDSIKSRVTARRPAAEVAERRAMFKRATPEVVFDSVRVRGGSEDENRYISYIFEPEKADTFGLLSAMNSYTKLISTGMMRDLAPQATYNPETEHFNLTLDANIKDKCYLGMGGYITSSANSMLFLSAGYRSLSFRTVDASLNGWIGQSYMAAELSARAILRHRQSSSIGLQTVVWRQKYYESDKLFYEDDVPAFITDTEFFTRAKFRVATGRHSEFAAAVGYGHTDDRFYNNDESIFGESVARNKLLRDMGQVMVTWSRYTLDDAIYPTSGQSIGFMGQGIIDHHRFIPGVIMSRGANNASSGNSEWLQAEFAYKHYFPIGKKISLGVETDIVASTLKLLDNYNASIVNAPAFCPSAASRNIFNPTLRANSFATLGVVPVWKLSDRLQLRGNLHGFVPMRGITQVDDGLAGYSEHWFNRVDFYCEIDAVVKLPVGNLTLYGNYQTTPGTKWGIGISFGYYILAPRFLRL